MCNKKTYINTFYTTTGATMLSSTLGITDNSGMVTETCTVINANGEKQENKDEHERDGKDDKNDDKMSSTMACDDNGNFEYSVFEGGDCDGSNYNSTEDTLQKYNEAMQGIDCVQIWSYEAYVLKSNSYGSSYSKNNNNRRQLGYGSPAETILKYSTPCNNYYYNGAPACPGPVDEPTIRMARSGKALRRFSWCCFVLGGIMLYLAYCIHLKKIRRAEKKMGLVPGSNGRNLYSRNPDGSVTEPSEEVSTLPPASSKSPFGIDKVSKKITKTASRISETLARTASKVTRGKVDVSSSKLAENDLVSPGVMI
jgi:hypothetical protein